MIQRDSSLKKPTTPLHRRNGRRNRRSRSGIRRDSATRTDYPAKYNRFTLSNNQKCFDFAIASTAFVSLVSFCSSHPCHPFHLSGRNLGEGGFAVRPSVAVEARSVLRGST